MRLFVSRWIICLALLVPLLAGCKSTTGGAGRGHPTYTLADPGFQPTGTLRLPVLGFANSSEAADAVSYFYPHLEDALREKPNYVMISRWTVQRDARRKKIEATHEALETQWRKNRAFDPDMLKEFGAAFGVEYVFGAEVSEWQEKEVDMNVEGYSHSDVAAAFKIIAVDTNTPVFEVRDKLEIKSAYYDPSTGASRSDRGGIARGENPIVPSPPPIDEVAKRVATNLVAALP